MRILVLEDDARYGPLLRDHLANARYTVDLVTSIADFESAIRVEQYDLYLIDLMLPDGDGMDLIARCRGTNRNVPILVTTGRSAIADRVAGLDRGADDYLVKPFTVSEMLARIRALLRRPAPIATTKVVVGRLTLDLSNGNIYFDGNPAWLSAAESRLLALLMRRRGAVVSKNVIYSQIYGLDCANTPNAVEQLVSRLRRSLANSSPEVDVKTVRGLGYLLDERRAMAIDNAIAPEVC